MMDRQGVLFHSQYGSPLVENCLTIVPRRQERQGCLSRLDPTAFCKSQVVLDLPHTLIQALVKCNNFFHQDDDGSHGAAICPGCQHRMAMPSESQTVAEHL